MTPTNTGWTIFITMIGAMCGLLAVDISKFTEWNEIFRPPFVASLLAHFSVVVGSFIGGRLIPNR